MTLRALALLLAFACAAPSFASASDHVNEATFPGDPQREQALLSFYSEWKKLYVTQGCGEGRYLVRVDADHKPVGGGTQAGTITVSEAHGYGMLLTVMMAYADPDARTVFDGMIRYFHDHPAASDPGLMAWNQIGDCSNAPKVNGQFSATDGDLDIAYALLLADRQWGREGVFDYRAEALKVLAAVMDKEVSGDVLLIGDWAKAGEDVTYAGTTRASDFMTSHFRAFADATGDQRWLSIRDRIYTTISAVSTEFAPRTGLMPDFIVGMPYHPKPAPRGFLEGDNDGDYSWNSGRYPWRIALDYLLYGEPRAKAALTPLTRWARSATDGKPQKFADTYRLNGAPSPGSGRNSMAFVPMLGVAAMVDARNQAWLDAIWTDVTHVGLTEEDYFGNTLKLLGMLTMTGHWAKP